MKRFLQQIYEHTRKYLRQVYLILLGGVLVGICTGAVAYVLRPLLDNLFISKDEQMLYILPLIIVGIYIIKGMGRYMQSYYSAFVATKVANDLRSTLLERIIYLDLHSFQRLNSGQILTKIVADVDKVKLFLQNNIAGSVRSVVTTFCLIGVVTYNSPKLAFLALFILPSMAYPLGLFAKKMKRYSKESQEKISTVLHKMNEILSNFEVIKSFRTEQLESQKFGEKTQEYFDNHIQAEKTNAKVGPIMEIISALVLAVTIIVGGNDVLSSNITPGAFFSFITALLMLYEPLKSLSLDYNRLQESIASYERIEQTLELKSNIIDGSEKLINPVRSIVFQNVSLSYEQTKALNDISVDITQGDIVALIGASGGGKSSFINLISRFYDTSHGTILVNNVDIKNLTQTSLRAKISLVSQRTFIFNDTIENNIIYGHKLDKGKLETAIKQAHCDFIQTLPSTEQTILEEFGTNLSGGQRQRIAIARAIYKQPDIYIFDEATSALDHTSEQYIKQSIKELAKNKIVFLVAHKMSSIDFANKIFIFESGKIVASDNYNNIIKHPAFTQLTHTKRDDEYSANSLTSNAPNHLHS